MKLYNIDWSDFLDRVAAWEETALDSRRRLVRLKPSIGVDGEGFGDDLDRLVQARVLQRFTHQDRVRLHPDFQGAAKALRAMNRFPIVQEPSSRLLDEALTGNFTSEERGLLVPGEWIYHRGHDRRLLSTVGSIAHLRGFLHAKDALAWEQERVPDNHHLRQPQSDTDSRLSSARDVADLRALLEALLDRSRPVPFRDLRSLLKRRSKVRIGDAIYAAIRYALAFPVLDPETLFPELTLWPGVAERWNRPLVGWPEPIDEARIVETYDVPWGMEDVTQVLVAAAESPRLRSNDRELFAKAHREIEASLPALPDKMYSSKLRSVGRESRVQNARRLATVREFLVETGTSGKTLRLELTDLGRDWLSRPPGERLALLLESMRAPDPSRAEEGSSEPDEEDVPAPWLHHRRFRFDDTRFTPYHGTTSELDWVVDFETAVAKALGHLDRDGAFAQGEVLRYLTTKCTPFAKPELLDKIHLRQSWSPWTEEDLEHAWTDLLDRTLRERFLRFGGVRLGRTAEGVATIELTDIGRYLLRRTDDLRFAPAVSEENAVRVQPDFEVVFLAPDPAREASFNRFAERHGTRVGVLFRITRASILAAARAGLARDEVLTTLRDSCGAGLPKNVEHEVGAWFEECRRLSLASALIIRCPDEDTAARVRSASGRHVEAASPTLLLLDPAHRAEVIRRCRKAGLFLEGGEPDAPKKSPRRRSRRRYY